MKKTSAKFTTFAEVFRLKADQNGTFLPYLFSRASFKTGYNRSDMRRYPISFGCSVSIVHAKRPTVPKTSLLSTKYTFWSPAAIAFS